MCIVYCESVPPPCKSHLGEEQGYKTTCHAQHTLFKRDMVVSLLTTKPRPQKPNYCGPLLYLIWVEAMYIFYEYYTDHICM